MIWYDSRCIGAKSCIDVCPNQALSLTSGGIDIDRDKCVACGECAEACPAAALEVVGKAYTVDEVVAKAVQDRTFFERSGGGVTLSGGEVSLQAEFAASLMEALRKEEIHIALDTCGAARWTTLKRLVELADLVLYDIKTMNVDDHIRYTGIPLRVVLENAQKVSRMGRPMWVRTAVIPGVNDSVENTRQTASFIWQALTTAQRYDLIAFNKACSTKYSRLGLVWSMEGEDFVDEARMEELAAAARDEGLDCVHWSGVTRQR